MNDLATLLPPLIIALVPILVAGTKRLIPETYRGELTILYPVLATALGPLLDYGSTFLIAHQTGPHAILYGMAGVALRELIDQARKLAKP